MDENPYKAPAELSGSSPKKMRVHPMLDPFWNRAQWAILILPFLAGITVAVLLSIFG